MNKGVDDPVDNLLVGVLATAITARHKEASVRADVQNTVKCRLYTAIQLDDINSVKDWKSGTVIMIVKSK